MTRLPLKLAFCATLLTAGSVSSWAAGETDGFIRTAQTSQFETDFTKAAEKTINSVVCIKSYVSRSARQQQYMDPFGGMMDPFEFFFGTPQQRQQPQRRNRNSGKKDDSDLQQAGLGSGVIISDDGYIVTNNHVVDGADKLEVLLNDNKTYEARIIGTDEMTDLALIKIEVKGLSPITFGNSDDVKIGEWVLAVGNPFGFNSTVTAGIVSAKARSLGGNVNRMGVESYIQTDAVLNPGNSGGALVNLHGELIGVNAAIYSNTGSYTGYSFAIPTTIVKKILTDIRSYGSVQRAVLGIRYQELDSKLAKEHDITATAAGIYVASVEPRSTAKELGLEEGDVITAINDTDVHTGGQLTEQMNRYRPGDSISVTYYRDNKRYTRSAVLRNAKGNTEIVKKSDFSELGCAFAPLTDELKDNLGINYGVQVKGLKSGLLKDAGVKDGFIIMTINDTPVRNVDDVEYIYNSIMRADDTEKVMFLTGYYSTGKRSYYAVPLESE